ncbi:DUF3460 family protein [Nitrosomonas sp. HPC101]|uniref:DUF3460 family protein n=1 Tax=Nitrosomonas sp. HPC101 TaxID=1658667 RepID=UPI001371A0DE|nr:DUF3460 family protein [Nitrosomonas sp. HPC101]MXS84619.1 DUF3460 family protein [Nitrosomonas sp. HPC101]
MDYSYESEHTKFMRELLASRPDLIKKQEEARAIWWDKKVDREALKRFKEARTPQKSYVYFSWPEPTKEQTKQEKKTEE